MFRYGNSCYLTGDAEEARLKDRSDFMKQISLEENRGLGVRFRAPSDCGNSPLRRRRSAHILEIYAIILEADSTATCR